MAAVGESILTQLLDGIVDVDVTSSTRELFGLDSEVSAVLSSSRVSSCSSPPSFLAVTLGFRVRRLKGTFGLLDTL